MTSGISLTLALVALTGVYAFDPRAFGYTLLLFALGAVYYFLFSRHNLIAQTAEEEFRLIARAEADLETAESRA